MLAAAASLGAGASALWHYNRGNFLFDRKLRQEQEFAIFEWRKVQAELWREDVRDIIEMTEKKMDSYLIITVLQLGMCSGLFACGRLEPGTPPWLLHFYMLTLGGAFMYLLMSVWLAMHAGVVAQCTSVRLLTQFVRLPVPDWHDFEGARTYAHAFESMRLEDMLRVPLFRSLATGDQPGGAAMPRSAAGPGYREWNEDPTAAMATKTEAHRSDSAPHVSFVDGGRATPHADPWRLERHGDERGFYELQRVTLEMRRHIRLARRAALQFQCFDAFARLSMSFGTHQLLFALAHYALGYLSVQDSLPPSQDVVIWPSMCICAISAGISVTMMQVDFSMTRWECAIGSLSVVAGLAASFASVILWVLQGVHATSLSWTLPITYVSNFAWLLNSLRVSGIVEDATTGIVLPMKFRSVLYLDVFGWLSKSPAERCTPVAKTPMPGGEGDGTPAETEPHREPSPKDPDGSARPSRIRRLLARWTGRGKEQQHGGEPRYSVLHRVDFTDVHTDRALFASIVGGSSLGASMDVELGDAGDEGGYEDDGDVQCAGPAGEIRHPPEHAFESTTFSKVTEEDALKTGPPIRCGHRIVTGHDRLRPSKMPGRLFHRATVLLALLWAFAISVPLELLHQYLAHPAVADLFLDKVRRRGELVTEKTVHVVVGTDVNGLPELRTIVPAPAVVPELGEGTRVDVRWPSHSAFVPRALASDREGRHIIVADDFGLYHGMLEELPASPPASTIPPKLSLSIAGAMPCTAMEGVAMRSVSSACDGGGACDALVLSAHGRTLTQCPSAAPGGKSDDRVPLGSAAPTWKIDEDWLEGGEEVTCFTIRDGCRTGSKFLVPNCMLAGTSKGRIVEMSLSPDREGAGGGTLVPNQVLLESRQPMPSGSLTDVHGQVTLALWYNRSALTAFDTSGRALGEWKLPDSMVWLLVSSGGDYIFLVGVRKDETPPPPVRRRQHRSAPKGRRSKSLVELHRIPLPEALRAAVASARRAAGGAGAPGGLQTEEKPLEL